MTVVGDLVAAIAADPNDEAPQLVIADLLQAEGDPRGLLIALDRAERAGELGDPAALEQLLLLAAEYSFPRASNDEEPMLVFERDGHDYTTTHDGLCYTVNDRGELAVGVYDEQGEFVDRHAYDLWIDLGQFEGGGAVFVLLSDAIRAGTPLDDLVFPQSALPLPTYDGGPLRGYRLPTDFLSRYAILRNRYGLAARDYFRWNAIWKRLRDITAAAR